LRRDKLIDFERIRDDNRENYGKRTEFYVPAAFSHLYSDRTHFIYELLQNAEDACERAGVKGYVKFVLFPDRLEMRHNGIPFDENDVRGICGIVEGTKSKEDLSQIGKFGIGFKSVFAFTNTPSIYSDDVTFEIRSYVLPHQVPSRDDVETGETLIVIPFNHKEVKKSEAYKEIQDRLKDLGLRTLLFIKNIRKIEWTAKPASGKYVKYPTDLGGCQKVVLQYDLSGGTSSETWIVFEKKLDEKHRYAAIQVAYLTNIHKMTQKPYVDIVRNATLSVFFPTEKETHLKFLINGPLQTTPARDNIQNNEANSELIKEIAKLVADSIQGIKNQDLLDVRYLCCLPIESDDFIGTSFQQIFYEVRKILRSNQNLLPTDEGYTNREAALLARGDELRRLLGPEQLEQLFGGVDREWLNSQITQDRTPELRSYLMRELEIPEISTERFGRNFSKEFIAKQTDSWVISFYRFLHEVPALWRKTSPYTPRINLRDKPFIRLQDDTHVPPFEGGDKPLAFLPSRYSDSYPTVKESIAQDRTAFDFLKSLGLTKPDVLANISRNILPRYSSQPIDVTDEENIEHVQNIVRAFKDLSRNPGRDRLANQIIRTPFLIAKNMGTGREAFRTPIDIHLAISIQETRISSYFTRTIRTSGF
jgi:hypothetical protein